MSSGISSSVFSSYTLRRAISAFACVCISRYLWANCRSISSARRFIVLKLDFWRRNGRSGDNKLDRRFEEMRVEYFCRMCSALQHLAMFAVIGGSMWLTYFMDTAPNNGFALLLPCLIHLICKGIADGSFRLTIRTIDAIISMVMLLMTLRICTSTDFDFFCTGSMRSMGRIFFAVIHLDAHKMLAWNSLLSFAAVWRCWLNMGLLETVAGAAVGTRQPFVLCSVVLIELITLAGIILVSMGVHQLQFSCLRAQVHAEDSQHAIHKILSVLCDAIVHLGPSGEIIAPSPQLHHVLRASTDEQIDGSRLSDHFAYKQDAVRLEEFLSSPACRETVSALHVHFRGRTEGPAREVELYHAYLQDSEDKPGHLIGLRESGVTEPPQETEMRTIRSPPGETPIAVLRARGRGRGKLPGTSSRSSARSSDADTPFVEPFPWPEISLYVDAMSEAVHSTTIHYVSPEDSDGKTSRHPRSIKLVDVMTDEDRPAFLRSLQSSANLFYRDPDAEPLSSDPVSLTLPCDAGHRTRIYAGKVSMDEATLLESESKTQGLLIHVRLSDLFQVDFRAGEHERMPVVSERTPSS